MSNSSTTLQLRTTRLDAGPTVEDIELPPEFLQAYTLGKVLGSGAMGMVVQAVQKSTRQTVAVKFLLRQTPELLERFLGEGRLLSQVRHPNVMWVFEVGNIAGHPYLVTECLEGGNLRQALDAGGLAPDRSPQVIGDILKGVAALHRAGIVHRDLKPENILFTADGRAKIADLGIARDAASPGLTKTGALIGTPLYMAPEQLAGELASTSTDVYAVGLIGYEILRGRHPFAAPNFGEVMRRQFEERPEPLPAGTPCARAVLRALEKRPDARPPSAEAMLELARETSAEAIEPPRRPRPSGRPVVPPPQAVPPARPSGGRSTVFAATLSLALVTAAAAKLLIPFFQPPLLLEGVEVDARTTAAKITWQCQPACYGRIEYWPASDPSLIERSKVSSFPETAQRHVLIGLRPQTEYRYRALMTRTVDPSSPTTSAEFAFRTESQPSISNIRVVPFAAGALVMWETSEPCTTAIQYATNGRYGERRTEPAQTAERFHSIMLRGLSPATTYTYRILARHANSKSEGEASPEGTFRTKALDGAEAPDDP